MDLIKISLSEVSQLSGEIRSLNNELNEELINVTQLMKELNNAWSSEGAETILARFERFAIRFSEEYETIENYASFLDRTVSSYDSLEATITANAGNFS